MNRELLTVIVCYVKLLKYKSDITKNSKYFYERKVGGPEFDQRRLLSLANLRLVCGGANDTIVKNEAFT